MSTRGWMGWVIVCCALVGLGPAACDKGAETKQPGAQPAKPAKAEPQPEPAPEVDADYEARKAAAVKELQGITGND
ncbi:MAG: hypothetical protein H6713_19225 [Myxococcales bacterium]|nr:hypothetical protein [Myxococcales bacterium]